MAEKNSIQINARLPRDLVLYLDVLRADMQSNEPERVVTRTDALVRCIETTASSTADMGTELVRVGDNKPKK